jgi:ABC-2 type transport system permease protein
MKALGAIYMRELRAYFHSAIAYVLIVGFLLITGYFFYAGVAQYAMFSLQAMQNPVMMKINLMDFLVTPLLGNMAVIFILVTPLLTMRLLSDERRTGTIELLLSYPVSDRSVVLAKFLAAWTMISVILALSWVHMLILMWISDPYLPAMASGYLGMFLLCGAFVALGIFASAVTENQIVAAVIAFAGLLLLWVLGWSSAVVGEQAGPILESFSLTTRLQGFTKGLIDTSDLAYFVLFMGFFIFVSIRVLEAKRWKA